MRSRSGWTVVFGCWLGGCSGVEGPCPSIDEVTRIDGGSEAPAEVYHREPATLRVDGDGFQVVPDGRDGDAELPTAGLGGPVAWTPALTWVDDQTLELELEPADPPAPPGSYSLSITNPDGCTVTLDDAVVVTDHPPRQIDPSIVIEAVIPPFGWVDAPTSVAIVGGGFESTPRAWLSLTDGLRADVELEQLAFIDGGSLSGVVPAGVEVGGPYDLWVENPDGGYNFLEDAYTVTPDPPPDILTVVPEAGDTQDDTEVVISGAHFVEGATVQLLDASGTVTEARVQGVRPEEILATIPSTRMGVGQYLVQVTHPDHTWDQHAAFVVRNPSAKLGTAGPWRASSPMVVPRRGHGLVSWVDGLGRAWLFAVGGDDGDGAHRSVERVQVDAFGELGPWAVLPTELRAARTQVGVAVVGGFVYAIGGTNEADGALATVERAAILVDEAGLRPVIVEADAGGAGGLDGGTWYYRVSAVLAADHAYNPAGETLASEVEVVRVPPGGAAVTLTWEALPEAASYRVYRTDAANGAAGQEHRIADGLVETSFTDDGLPAGTVPFVPEGALGEWVVLDDELPAPWSHGATAVAARSGGPPIVYLVGGTGGGQPLDEVLAMEPPGPWFPAGRLGVARADNGAAVVGYDQAQALGPGTPTYLVAFHGATQQGITAHGEQAEIGPDGRLGPFTELSRIEQDSKGRVDGWGLAAANHLYVLGGGEGQDDALSDARQSEVQGPGLDLGPWSSSSSSGSLTVPRADFGLTPVRAVLYAAGGTTDAEQATTSVEQVVY